MWSKTIMVWSLKNKRAADQYRWGKDFSSREEMHTCLPPKTRGPIMTKVMHCTKKIDELIVSTVVTNRSIGEGILTGSGITHKRNAWIRSPSQHLWKFLSSISFHKLQAVTEISPQPNNSVSCPSLPWLFLLLQDFQFDTLFTFWVSGASLAFWREYLYLEKNLPYPRVCQIRLLRLAWPRSLHRVCTFPKWCSESSPEWVNNFPLFLWINSW